MALDVTAWADELVGGRVVRLGRGWFDMAAAAPVTLQAWLLDDQAAARWEDVHADALDAWVLARPVGWAGVRLDVINAAGVVTRLETRVELSASLTGSLTTAMSWRRAAIALRKAGVVPVTPAAAGLLWTRPATWWGDVAAPVTSANLSPAERAAFDTFEAAGGRVAWLAAASARDRERSHQEKLTMRDIELLDLFEGMEQASDERDALRVVCTFVKERLGATQVGASLRGGHDAVTVGSGEPVPQSWLTGCLLDGSTIPLTTSTSRVLAAPALDCTGTVGGLWAQWPLDCAVPIDGPRVLGVCARLAAPRLAACAAVPAAVLPAPTARLIGDGPLMIALRSQLSRAARSPFPVLLLGESGSGKELAARTVHEAGPRRGRRFVAVNCAALPDDLVEAEFFGHARGAYTGAVGERAGVFEEADGGTLFLDEVGDLSLRAQAKLLRVLQEGEVRRLGENGPRRVDVRIIAATNVPLDEAARSGAFRADLYYRLAVVCVRLPPLRERRDDIPALVAHLWAECARRVGTSARLHPALMAELAAAEWPGNVRELQNVLAALAVDAPRRGVVLPRGPGRSRAVAEVVVPVRPPDAGLEDARRQFEASFVSDALLRAGGRRTEAARSLGLSRQGLTKLVRRLGLDRPPAAPRPQ